MRRRWGMWGFVLLLTLNVSALGTVAYHRWAAVEPPARETHSGHRRHHFFREELGLSGKQWQQVEQLRRSFETEIEPLRRKMREKNSEMVRLLRTGEPDRGRLDAVLDEIATLQKQVQAQVAEHLVEQARVLTEEQREKLFDLVERGVCPGEGHHGFGGHK